MTVWPPLFAALAGHWRRNPVQFVALLAGLTVATALWSGVQALNGEARQSYAEAAAVLDGDRVPRFEPVEGAGAPLDLGLYVRLRRAGWDVSPLIEGRLRVGARSLRVIGVDPLTMPAGRLSGALAAAGTGGAGIAAFAAPPWQLLAAAETLEALGLSEGQRPATADGRPLPPVLPASDLPPDLLVTDIGAAAALLGRGEALDALLLDPSAIPGRTPWQEVSGGALRLVEPGGETDLERLTASFHLNLTAFGFLSFAVGLFIAHAAVGLAFEQRLSMFRTLRAMGVSAWELTVALLAETVAAALVAGLAGLAIGYAIAAALLPDVAATLAGLYGASVEGNLTLRPSWALAGLAMSLAGAVAAASGALWRAARLGPLATARRQAWRGAQVRKLRLQALAGLGALVLGAAVLAFGSGLSAGFAAMGGLLLGATLLLPGLLAAVLAALCRFVRTPLLAWAVADSRQQISGLGLALMALLLALSTNIGVSTMVGSFRDTFTGWLDRRLFADLYVDPRDEAEAAALDAWAAGRTDVEAVLHTRRTDIRLAGADVTLMGRPAHAAYRTTFPFLEAASGAWNAIGAGSGAMISEQLSRRAELGVGDTLTLPLPDGPWPLEVVAVYADYGNPRGEVGVGLAAMEARVAGARLDGSGLLLALGYEVAPVLAALEREVGIGGNAMRDTASLKRFSHSVFERTFAVTGMLNVLTLGVAGVALFLSLLTLADQRIGQLAPLWAAGVERRKLALVDLGKTVGLAALTVMAALPLGLAVAWLLVAQINPLAFGWRLPLTLFPGQWAALGALTLGVAMLAALWPAWRLSRLAPARLVKIFAEER